jgi:ubiquitin-like-conjugating enzyme ATG3
MFARERERERRRFCLHDDSICSQEGMLTPEEFVFAGEALVYRCPTWSWASGLPANVVPYLPPDKQFLITKNVPCLGRASDLERHARNTKNESISIDGEDEWVGMVTEKEEIVDIGGSSRAPPADAHHDDDDDDDDDNVPDLDDFDPADNEIVDHDGGTSHADGEDTILKTRTYDISIHYDKFYRTPRVWLFGYDENGRPLKPEEIFLDISQDHANKTVTIDRHPHLGSPQAYIHPCKHAVVMKKIMEGVSVGGKEVRIDQYMFLFLKFISSVIPTFDYDFTIAFDA